MVASRRAAGESAYRIALRTRTLEKDCEELRSKGVEFWTEPIMFELKNGRQEGFVCCTDPRRNSDRADPGMRRGNKK
jgi:hypothetical protein